MANIVIGLFVQENTASLTAIKYEYLVNECFLWYMMLEIAMANNENYQKLANQIIKYKQ